jgi:hypothetical protein
MQGGPAPVGVLVVNRVLPALVPKEPQVRAMLWVHRQKLQQFLVVAAVRLPQAFPVRTHVRFVIYPWIATVTHG